MKISRNQSGFMATSVLAFCFQSATASDEESALHVCTVINSMGAAVECKVSESERAVDLMVGDEVADAAEFCSNFSEMVAMVTTTMSDDWKMRMYTPEKGDTPAAVCALK
jgi:hypothetical protein